MAAKVTKPIQQIMISIENLDADSAGGAIINSPRSLEACRREGILPRELIPISMDELKSKNMNMDAKGLQDKLKFKEQKRKQKIREIITRRLVVIDEEQAGTWSENGVNKSSLNSKYSQEGQSSLVEKEKRQIEKIKKRQLNEIGKMMESELLIQEIRKKNEEKQKQIEQREQQKIEELEQKRLLDQEEKMRRESEKNERSLKEIDKLKELVAKEKVKENERIQHEVQRERQREIELQKKEEERKQKLEKIQIKIEENIRQQDEELKKKLEERDNKQQNRQLTMLEKQKNKELETAEQRQKLVEKLKLVKLKSDEDIKKISERYQQKQTISEKKLEAYENEKRLKLEESKKLADQHSEEIQKIIANNAKLENEKKIIQLKKIDDAEERKRLIDLEKEKERELKIKWEKGEEEKRKLVFDRNLEEQLKISEGLVKKFNQKDELVKKLWQDRVESRNEKRNQVSILMEDKRENVERIVRKQEFERSKLQVRIDEKMFRAAKIQEDLNKLLLLRKDMRSEIETQKQGIMAKLQKMKDGKLDPAEFTKETQRNDLNSSQKLLKNKEPTVKIEKKEVNKATEQKESKNTQVQINDVNQKDGLKFLEALIQRQNLETLHLLEKEQDNVNKYKQFKYSKANTRDMQMQKAKDKNEKIKLEKTHQNEKVKAQLRIQKLQDKHQAEKDQMKVKFSFLTN